MKHNLKIILILLGMFIIAQFIGLYFVNYYSPTKIIDNQAFNNTNSPTLPYGMETPKAETSSDYATFFYSILFSFIIAIIILFTLTHINADFIIKFWFFAVIITALGIAFNVLTRTLGIEIEVFTIPIVATLISIPLAFYKIYKKSFLIHNLTELLIYPGIAVVFIPLLNIKTIIILLILISVYDMWAVWKSGIMQKMAKYQINKLNIFGGFFIPYASKKIKAQMIAFRELSKKQQEKLKNKKIKINIAMLGGGDVIFPIIASGVMLKEYGFVSVGFLQLPLASLFVIIGATLGLLYLFIFSEKKKFYPAMPFITIGIFLGMLLAKLVL